MDYNDPMENNYYSDDDYPNYEDDQFYGMNDEDLHSEAIQKIFEGLNPRQVEAVEC